LAKDHSYGYIFIYLSTDVGRRELIRESYGTSIPSIPKVAFSTLKIPGIDTVLGEEIGRKAISALEKRTLANEKEDEAQKLLMSFLNFS